jgi:enolase
MGFTTALVADEGGLAAPFDANERAIEAVVDGITRAGLLPGDQVSVALDVAATECQVPGGYRMGGETLTSAEFVDRVIGWRRQYPIVSIEDGAGEDDDAGWSRLGALCASTQVLGDDRYVTTVTRLRAGMAAGEANSVLVKPNQAGTLGQALQVLQEALDGGWAPVVSARSGETEETWLADLATGSGAGQIKVGSTMRSERTSKWNRLLYLEQAHDLPYAGAPALAPRTG